MFRNFRPDRCYIIAEIGGNFTTLEQARRLIDAAAGCGVDAVKLQTFKAETLSSRAAIFDMENTGVTSQFDLFRKYEIDEDLHRAVFAYADSKGLDWFSTPSHETDVDFLETCEVGAHKIGSDDAVNLPFLRYVASKGKPVLLSTGMCTLQDVREAVDAVLGEGNEKLVLLHAVTSYPTHHENVNLRAIQTLQKEFPGIEVGYSCHTLSPIACLCAVAMGARVIERHFTYDKNADGPDHQLSADPTEMRWLVDAVRDFEAMRGTGVKRPADSERATRRNNRKSLVAARAIKAGEPLTRADVAIKRPGTGMAAELVDQVVGRRASRDLEPDELLSWDLFL